MKTMFNIIQNMYVNGKLNKDDIMFCINSNYLQVDEVKNILGSEYVEEIVPPDILVNLEYEKRLSALEQSTYNKEDIHKIINEVAPFPDIISGGIF